MMNGQAGVKTTAQRYPGLVHGFMAVPRILPQAKRATAEVGAFLKQEFDWNGESA